MRIRRLLSNSRVGQFDAVQQLGPFALALGLLAITLGAVAIVLASMQTSGAAYDEILVQNESASPATPLPTNVTVSEESDPNFEGLEDGTVSVVLNDTDPSDGSFTFKDLSEDGNYTVYYDDGIIQYDDLGGNYSTAEGDNVLQDYEWLDSDTTAHDTLGDGLTAMSDFGGWLGILVIMGVITIIFLFLGVIRRAGSVATA